MRTMKWVSFVGLAVIGMFATGCATNPCDPGGMTLKAGSVRGVVQVQRQTLDPMGNPVGTPITVAFVTLDQSDDKHQMWVSAEPLPIQPAGLVNGCSTRMILKIDPDHVCPTMQSLTDHVRLLHEGWYTAHLATLLTYDITEKWIEAPFPPPPPTTTTGTQ